MANVKVKIIPLAIFGIDSWGLDMIKSVIKSGYPDYPKSGFIRTILETEIRSLKTE